MIYDITQELFSGTVYPGDPTPQRTVVLDMKDGAICNLSSLSMCAHNGTHVDAPYHFLKDGATIDQIPLEAFVGECYVAHAEGDVSGEMAAKILEKAKEQGAEKRILIAGKATVTKEAALVFAENKLLLYGNESQTVGPLEAPMEVHLIMLGANIVLLEGIVLKDVPEGKYFLSAAPLNMGGCDGAPCRALLIRK